MDNRNHRRRFAIVGVGARAQLYSDAICGEFSQSSELVALCDLNAARLKLHNELLCSAHGILPLPCFLPSAFEEMIHKQQVDCVIIASIDCTHHEYIIRALTAGCDVICEKPLTTTATACRQIQQAVDATGRKIRVGFNYRYSPRNSRVKQLLASGEIGKVLSVHFEWLLDTTHGADYFRRWHREKRFSGGLLVHKASHHFDLMNWWLASKPVSVYAVGRLAFYGEDAARARECDGKAADPDGRFALKWDPALQALYGPEAMKCDGYKRDQDVFGSGITIEDDAAALVTYASGATMTYHLTCYSPWEGLRVSFNGTRGRLEYEVVENTCVAGAENDANLPHRPMATAAQAPKDLSRKGGSGGESVRIVVHRHWSDPVEHSVPCDEAGHGGGDARMLKDIFVGNDSDPLGRMADHSAGVAAVSVGIAANESLQKGQPCEISTLLLAESHATATRAGEMWRERSRLAIMAAFTVAAACGLALMVSTSSKAGAKLLSR